MRLKESFHVHSDRFANLFLYRIGGFPALSMGNEKATLSQPLDGCSSSGF